MISLKFEFDLGNNKGSALAKEAAEEFPMLSAHSGIGREFVELIFIFLGTGSCNSVVAFLFLLFSAVPICESFAAERASDAVRCAIEI